MQSLSSKWYGNQLPGELLTSWEPLFRANAGVFCCILKGNKHTNQPWTSLFATASHKRTKSLNIKQHKAVFLSHKTHCTWHFLRTRIINFETHNEHDVCVLHEGQTLCFTKDVLSDGTKQTWNKEKRCSVCTLLRWFTANEEQIPVDTTFGVNHVCRGYVTEGTISTEHICSKHSSTETFGLKLLGSNLELNTLNKQGPILFTQMSPLDRLGIWIDFLR